MKIKLEPPFSEYWRKGYLVTNKEPRRNVILYKNNNVRKTISYARYLLSVSLGRFLNDDEIVDHINGDQMDDRLENYQILTTSENISKGNEQNGKTRLMVEMECPCGNLFKKPRNTTHLTIKTKKSDYCCRSCSGLYGGKETSKILREYRR